MLEKENEKATKGQRFTWDDLKAEIERQEAASLGNASSQSKEAENVSSWSEKDYETLKHRKLPRSLPLSQPSLTKPTATTDELTSTDIENIKSLPIEERARLLLKLEPTPSVTKLSKEFVEKEIMALREQAENMRNDLWGIPEDAGRGLTELDRYMESQQELGKRIDRALSVYYRNVLQPHRQWHRRQVLQNFNKPQISRALVPWAASELNAAFHAMCIKGVRFGIKALTKLRKW